jgi:methionine aminopeptidase
MKALKKIVVSLSIAGFMAASSAAMAANPTDAEVKEAIDNTIAKIEESISAIEQGTDNEVLGAIINEARQSQKEISNNALDLKRNRAAAKLKNASREVKNSELQPAEQELRDALSAFKEIKTIYDQTH